MAYTLYLLYAILRLLLRYVRNAAFVHSSIDVRAICFLVSAVMIAYPFRRYERSYDRRVSRMGDMCILCLCSSCITSSFLSMEIRLPGFRALIDKVRYPGFVVRRCGSISPTREN